MSRNKKIEKDQNPPPKSIKPKGLMKLMRSTFIDEIIRKEESQALVGPRTISRKIPTEIPQAADLPSTPYVEIHSQINGTKQSFQVTKNLHYNPSQEGKSCNLRGEGETSETAKAEP